MVISASTLSVFVGFVLWLFDLGLCRLWNSRGKRETLKVNVSNSWLYFFSSSQNPHQVTKGKFLKGGIGKDNTGLILLQGSARPRTEGSVAPGGSSRGNGTQQRIHWHLGWVSVYALPAFPPYSGHRMVLCPQNSAKQTTWPLISFSPESQPSSNSHVDIKFPQIEKQPREINNLPNYNV